MIEQTPINEELLRELIQQSRIDGKASKLLMQGISEQVPGVSYVALQPGHKAYVIPHCHPNAKETFNHLRGELELIIFYEEGRVRQKHILGVEGTKTLTVEKGLFHTLIALTCNAAISTIYHGRYEKETFKVTPDWAVPEDAGEARIERYMRKIQTAKLD